MLSANSLNTSLKALKSLIRSFKNLLVDWYINLISSFKSPIWLFKEVFSKDAEKPVDGRMKTRNKQEENHGI